MKRNHKQNSFLEKSGFHYFTFRECRFLTHEFVEKQNGTSEMHLVNKMHYPGALYTKFESEEREFGYFILKGDVS